MLAWSLVEALPAGFVPASGEARGHRAGLSPSLSLRYRLERP